MVSVFRTTLSQNAVRKEQAHRAALSMSLGLGASIFGSRHLAELNHVAL